MAKSTEKTQDVEALHADAEAELQELRDAALMLGRNLKDFGRARLRAAEADLSESQFVREGRRMAGTVGHQIGDLEKGVERSIRAHPANWIAGTLGVVGVGMLIGMLMRRNHE